MTNSKTNKIKKSVTAAIAFSVITGAAVGCVVTGYKYLCATAIGLSQTCYDAMRQKLWIVPIALVCAYLFSWILSVVYKRLPSAMGGGIPTSVAVLRGRIPFKWFANFISVFTLSIAGFVTGVPLGNEGPCVQMGTALGRGSVKLLGKSKKALDRYIMTAGACAGFAAATGAPVSGILFAIEEAHHKISPLLVTVSFVAVSVCTVTVKLLTPLLGVSPSLFPAFDGATMALKDLWIPLCVGTVMGICSVGFLFLYKGVKKIADKLKIGVQNKIFAAFTLTIAVGLISFSFVSTGHEFIKESLDSSMPWYFLLAALVLRSLLTLFFYLSGITGGIFLPILAVGAAASALVAKLLVVMGMDSSLALTVQLIGIAACMSGMMKTPIIAVAFGVEALSLWNNLLGVTIASGVAYCITELVGVESVTDAVVEDKIENINKGKEHIVYEAHAIVGENSFAEGKHVRDVLWPPNCFVLSVQKKRRDSEIDEHGDLVLNEGDMLHIRYTDVEGRDIAKNDILALIGQEHFVSSVEVEI